MNWFSYACAVVMTLSVSLSVYVVWLNPRSALNWWSSLATLALGFWCFWGPFVVQAPDASSFWLWVKWFETGYLAANALSLPLVAALCRVPAWAFFLGTVPVGLACLAEGVQLWTGPWIVGGFQATPWGNLVVSRPDAVWDGVNAVTELMVSLVTYSFLIWAWRTNRSRRYRSIVVQYALMLLTINVGWALVVAFLVSRGLPDVSVLLSVVGIANLAIMIRRYNLLKTQKPEWNTALFRTLSDPVFVVNTQGVIVEVSQAAAALVGLPPQDLAGRAATEVLKGWPDLASRLAALGPSSAPEAPLNGRLGAGEFRLGLTPIVDGFDDVSGLLLRLEPAGEIDLAASRFALSQRERDVVSLVKDGLSTDEIAQALFIAPATVKKHINNLFRKTGVSSRGKLLRILG